jgi:hypothetical protein
MSKAVLLQGINISWQDGLPQDMTEAIQQESQAYQAGLTSRETSIRRLYGLDGKELQDELDRIEEEQALTSVPLATNTPFNQNDNSGGSEE